MMDAIYNVCVSLLLVLAQIRQLVALQASSYAYGRAYVDGGRTRLACFILVIVATVVGAVYHHRACRDEQSARRLEKAECLTAVEDRLQRVKRTTVITIGLSKQKKGDRADLSEAHKVASGLARKHLYRIRKNTLLRRVRSVQNRKNAAQVRVARVKAINNTLTSALTHVTTSLTDKTASLADVQARHSKLICELNDQKVKIQDAENKIRGLQANLENAERARQHDVDRITHDTILGLKDLEMLRWIGLCEAKTTS
jgi:hypothetical protein